MFVLIDTATIVFITLIFLTIHFHYPVVIFQLVMDYHLLIFFGILVYSFFKYNRLYKEKGIIYFFIQYILGCLRYGAVIQIIALYCSFLTYHVKDSINLLYFMILCLIPYIIIWVVFFIEDVIFENDIPTHFNIMITLMMILLLICYLIYLFPNSFFSLTLL